MFACLLIMNGHGAQRTKRVARSAAVARDLHVAIVH